MIQAGQPEPFGVTPLNVFVGAGGQGYCLVDAPDAESIVRAHEAQVVPLPSEDVVQMTSLV